MVSNVQRGTPMHFLFRPSCPYRPSCPSWLLLCALTIAPSSASARQIEGGVSGGVVGGVISAPGQPPRDRRPASGRSVIRGRVLSDNGQPMRRATVRASAPETRGGARSTSTDTEGRYEIRDLPAGRYTISVSKPAFVNWSYGQTQPNGPSKPVVLADNQTADNIDVRLPRGGVIAGRVTDEFGEPVPNVSVAPIRKQYSQGQRRLLPSGARAQTNDIGEYRIFGLQPGQYFVSASAQAQNFAVPTPNGIELSGERSGFASTFYPATADPASARTLTVGVGQTIGGIDIALMPARLSTISGIAIDGQGRPLTGGGVSAIVRGAGSPAIGLLNGPVRQDGTFTLPNVPPGEYIVRVARPSQAGAIDGRPEFSVAFVTINGEDLSGLMLAPIVPVTLSGRLVFDDSGAAQSLKPSNIRVLAQSFGVDDGLIGLGVGGIPPPLTDDFRFELTTPPGRIGLRPQGLLGPNATVWQLKAIRVDGVDVTDTGIDVGPQGVKDVEIEMTNRGQQISGTVTDAAGAPVKDYTVALFSQNRAHWTEPMARRFAVGRPIDGGGFKVITLPPGEYYAIALGQLDVTDWQDPATLENLSRLATAFALTSGDSRTLDLRLVNAP
jgi:protocatechuate 3,4-dioxygenase beta subunit